MKDTHASLRCAPCGKGFSTRGHLHRHERLLHHLYHPDSSPCPFCHTPFARIDTMRRHTSRCPERGHRDTPKTSRRGPKKTCCLRCSRMKVACDKGDPCSRCKLSDFPCEYDGPTKETKFAKSCHSTIDLRSKNADAPTGSTHARRDKTSIPFLLSYVDPERSFEDLMKVTNENPVGYSRDKENTADILGSQQIWDSSVDQSTWSFLHGLCGLFDFPENADSLLESEPIWNIQDQQQSDAVKVRFDYLFNEFELYSSRTKPQDLRNTYEIADLDITIRTYFDYAARHTPIIYISHFNIYTISSPLLLAILAAGGQLPHLTDSPFSSSQFFDLVQDFIFDQEILRNPYSRAAQIHTFDDNVLETLQAALIMLCTEVATRDNPVSNRTCKLRFSKLVAAIRALSLTKVRRYNHSVDDSSHRKRFLKEEAMIRLAWMASLLDIQFVLFFRTPPQFTIVEMTGDLPCADEIYTETPDSGMEPLSRSTCEIPGISLSSLIDTLMQPIWSDNNHLRRVNARGLFSGICGLHSIIFSAQTAHSVPHMRPILDRALDRWRVLWDSIYEAYDTKQLEMLGFMKHALEFWVLAKELLGADPHVLQVDNVDWPSKDNVSIIYRRIFNEAA